ncbi:MAG: phosphate ABC transporter permease PstA [Spirochaetales bacterium]|jgi:phosphate transport system permease protein|nr:phosphate ABC transporter permease PstA [Spirochaetales bacterium]
MNSATVPKELFTSRIERRRRHGKLFLIVFQASTYFAIAVLGALLFTVINDTFGYVALAFEIAPETLAENGVTLENMSKEQLTEILKGNISSGLMRRFEHDKPFAERSRSNVYDLVMERVVDLQVIDSWTLTDSLFRRTSIEQYAESNYPHAVIQFRSWLSGKFLVQPQSSVPENAGIRAAIFGTLWMVLITIVVAFPLGVGAAVYLEEYAGDNVLTRIIQVNIYNLAGVPSIIYGMVGLAIFVRLLEPITSGSIFGAADPATANGRTIISAGLTLALLILPIIIINSQEAIKAVPQTLRYSSLGLGATRWQTVWHHVLPSSIDRILTGTILAVSRAIGETAPLIVVGASTFVSLDPTSLFSKFTTLPIQIYQWTARPQAEFRHVAAAAIMVLLVLLLGMNASAIIMRNKFSKRRSAE